MTIEPVVSPTGVMYRASINQKGVATSVICKSRKEALIRCWHNYVEYLWK